MIIYDPSQNLSLSIMFTEGLSLFIKLQVILMTVFDQDALCELDLYARNFSGRHYNNIGICLSKFHRRGDYNVDTAIGFIERNLVMPAAKDYLLCHGSMSQNLRNTFPKGMRTRVAEMLEESFRAEFNLGNYWN